MERANSKLAEEILYSELEGNQQWWWNHLSVKTLCIIFFFELLFVYEPVLNASAFLEKFRYGIFWKLDELDDSALFSF